MRLRILCAAGLMLVTSFGAYAATERPYPMISVTGEGSITAMPDIAHLQAGIVSEGKTSREAGEANARLMTAVVAAARQAGIAERDIGTSRYTISPVYNSGQNRDRESVPRIVGYRAQNTVQVKIRDIGKVGDIIDVLTAAGANNLGGVSFEVSGAQKMLDEARLAAFADAKRKAELYAKTAGGQIGRVVSLSEQDAEMPRPTMMARAAPQSGAAPPTPIAPGEERIRVQVSVTFELSQ